MYRALYREWRPARFDDMVGQKHITTTLKNEIINNRIAHAYLFTGTRGTGKTSTSKIFSKALNCLNLQHGEPCNECDMCKKINSGTAIDVVEMDAASKNKVEHIRELIEEVQYPPHEAKYKVYIMDEAHMLTTAAVNAFLKTLEEPPSNVVFILATTDPQKLPITILSRCQRFDFTRIKSEDIADRLREIVDELGVFCEDDALNLIARASDGAMRDSLSVLDQAIAMGDGKVDYQIVASMLGIVTNDSLLVLTDEIVNRNIEKCLTIIEDVILSGKEASLFLKELVMHFRNLMIAKVSITPEKIIDMSSENLQRVREQARKVALEDIMRNIRILQEAEEASKWSKQGRIYLELAIIKICKVEYDNSTEVLLARINQLEDIIKSGKITVESAVSMASVANDIKSVDTNKQVVSNQTKQVKVAQNTQEPIKIIENTNSTLTVERVKSSWKDILDTFKARRLMIINASLLTGKVVGCKNGVVTIYFDPAYSFNKDRLLKSDNKKLVDEIFTQTFKEKVVVNYVVGKEAGEEDNLAEQSLKNAFGEEMFEVIDE